MEIERMHLVLANLGNGKNDSNGIAQNPVVSAIFAAW